MEMWMSVCKCVPLKLISLNKYMHIVVYSDYPI